jgi:membrane-associated phospholipid phosphatase
MDNLLKKTIITAGMTAVLYLVLFFFCDRVIDLWVYNNYASTWLHQTGSYVSLLGKGSFFNLVIAALFMFIIIYDCDLKRHWTRKLLYILTCISIAIIIGDGFKYLLGRYRPVMLFQENLYGFHFFASTWAVNSTPSGHTIRAFALFTALSLLYRRFTVIFISIAVLIGLSRVLVTDHYPSDVLLGAFIGIFTAIWTYRYFWANDNRPKVQVINP